MKSFVVMCAVAAMLAFTASDAHARKCCAKVKTCKSSCNTGCKTNTCCAQTAPAPCQVASCQTGCAQTASCCKTKNTCHAKPCCATTTACAVTACSTTTTTPVIAKPYEEVKAPEAPAPAPAPAPAK